MKYLETIIDELHTKARQRQKPPAAGQARVDLDEDLFSPIAAAPAGLDHRSWPTLDVPRTSGPNALEKKVAEQERELLTRCSQVADLYSLQERQTAELQVAYAEIDRVNAAFAALQDTATQHATTAADRKKAITALHQENAILRSKLEKSLDDMASLASQMLTVETMFNNREMVITTALEQADLLKAELATAADEKDRLTAELEAAGQRHGHDRDRQMAVIDELNRKVESLFADHGVQLKTREKLAKRCDELTRSGAALAHDHGEALSKLAAQSEHGTFLEAVLRAERETSEARIKELTEKLEQERLQRSVADRDASAKRQEIAILIRHLARRRQETAGARQNAA